MANGKQEEYEVKGREPRLMSLPCGQAIHTESPWCAEVGCVPVRTASLVEKLEGLVQHWGIFSDTGHAQCREELRAVLAARNERGGK